MNYVKAHQRDAAGESFLWLMRLWLMRMGENAVSASEAIRQQHR